MLLCFFGFLKEFRPSESYTTDFTAFPYRNITREQVRDVSQFILMKKLFEK